MHDPNYYVLTLIAKKQKIRPQIPTPPPAYLCYRVLDRSGLLFWTIFVVFTCGSMSKINKEDYTFFGNSCVDYSIKCRCSINFEEL